MEVLFEKLTPDELYRRIKNAPVAYLPLGSLEWHGPHLPLGADMIQPSAFFIELANRVGGVVLPPLFMGPDTRIEKDGKEFYGMDDNDLVPGRPYQLPGSAYWVDEALYTQYLDAIVKQLSRIGIKIVVAHGHGPSTTASLAQAEEWQRKHGVKLFTMWGLFDERELGFMIDHAAANETSIMLAIHPELVKMEKLPRKPSDWPLGTSGDDPRHFASAEVGRRIVEANIEAMTQIIRKALAEFGNLE